MKKIFIESIPMLYAAIAGFNVYVGNYGFALFVALMAVELLACRVVNGLKKQP